MTKDNCPPLQSLGPGSADVIFLHNLQHAASHMTNPAADLLEGKDKARHYHMTGQIRESMDTGGTIHAAGRKDLEYDVVVGPESRGFIFGTPIAYNNHKPFVLIRKKGKLPCETVAMEYELEYGTAVIEIHKDAIRPGQKVLIVDDLIATGGTTEAMIRLVESLGGQVVGVVVLMELKGLKGREKIAGYRLESAIQYEGN